MKIILFVILSSLLFFFAHAKSNAGVLECSLTQSSEIIAVNKIEISLGQKNSGVESVLTTSDLDYTCSASAAIWRTTNGLCAGLDSIEIGLPGGKFVRSHLDLPKNTITVLNLSTQSGISCVCEVKTR